MRKNLLLLILTVFSFSLFAENYTINLDENNQTVEILQNDYQKLNVKINLSGIHDLTVSSEKGTFSELFIPGLHAVGDIGTPKLPALKKLIEIPFGAEVSVQLKDYTLTEYNLSEYGIEHYIMPVQPSVSKSQDPAFVEFEYNEAAYQQSGYTKHPVADVQVLGTLRGMRLARLVVAPVSYNPVNGTIKVMNNIELEVSFKNSNKSLTEKIKRSTYSPYFQPVYDAVLNPRGTKDGVYDDHPDLTKYPVKYVIISDRMFEETLQEFIAWKTKKGFEVIVEYTDELGSSVSEIQTYLHELYNAATEDDPAPSFVLFVGDTPQIPASATGSSSGKKTDLYYCEVDENDDYTFPDMFYGRFSATSAAMLQNIIDKTLYYEQYQFEDPAYLDRVTLIAGADYSWNPAVGQPTVNYGTENYFNEAQGYSTVNAYLSSYSGCYETIDEGVGFINYTAHCSTTSWGDPNLSISDVNSFANENMYPLAIGNCCLAADFGYGECIGETWLRAENKGAVAYIGSSPSSYWFEDFYWAVGAFPISGNNDGYVPTVEETTLGAYDAPFISDYVSVDALIFVGNLAVTEVDIQNYPQHSSPLYYWQAYNCLGDPSLVIYHTQGEENNVSYMDILPLGLDQFEVNAEPGSYVAISFDGILHGAALVDESGTVSVPIDPILEAGYADIVVTKPQYIPYAEQVIVAPLEGPYVLVDSTSVTDQNGNANGIAEYGEEIKFNVFLKNVGTDLAEGIEVVLRTDDEYVTLVDSTESWADIAAESIVSVDSAFAISVSETVDDQHMVNFTVLVTGNDIDQPWASSFSCILNAPVLSLQGLSLDDETGGNGNGRLDPGEMINISINAANLGHAVSPEATCSLTTHSEYIEIVTGEVSLGEINTYGAYSADFEVIISPETPVGTITAFNIALEAGGYSRTFAFTKKVGLIMDDFESGNLMSFDWTTGETFPWFITEEAYEGGYAVKSADIDDEETSWLELTMNVEAADTIAFYKKVSSESGWDYLRFYMNDTEMGEWSGEVDWSIESYAVDTGEYTFRWAYEKDYSISNGEDCAWIDYVLLPGGMAAGNTNHMPEFMTEPDTLAETGQMYQFDIETHDQDEDAVSLHGPVLPEWLSLEDHGDGTGVVSGTPMDYHKGDTMYVVQANDGYVFNTMCVFITVDYPVNSNELAVQNLLTVYPNPAKDVANLKYNLDETANVIISLVNMLGEEVYRIVNEKQSEGSYHEQVDTRSLNEGMYYCKFSINGKSYTVPIVITQ